MERRTLKSQTRRGSKALSGACSLCQLQGQLEEAFPALEDAGEEDGTDKAIDRDSLDSVQSLFQARNHLASPDDMTVAAEQQDKGLPFGWKKAGGLPRSFEASTLKLCSCSSQVRRLRSRVPGPRSTLSPETKGALLQRALSLRRKVSNYFERRVYLPNQNILTEGEEPRYGAPRRN